MDLHPITVPVEGRVPPQQYYKKHIVQGTGERFTSGQLRCKHHDALHPLSRFSHQMSNEGTPDELGRSCMDEEDGKFLYCRGHGGIHPYSSFSPAMQQVARAHRYCLHFYHYDAHEQDIGIGIAGEPEEQEVGSLLASDEDASDEEEEPSSSDQEFYTWDSTSDSEESYRSESDEEKSASDDESSSESSSSSDESVESDKSVHSKRQYPSRNTKRPTTVLSKSDKSVRPKHRYPIRKRQRRTT